MVVLELLALLMEHQLREQAVAVVEVVLLKEQVVQVVVVMVQIQVQQQLEQQILVVAVEVPVLQVEVLELTEHGLVAMD